MMSLPEGSSYDTRPIKAKMKSKAGELFSQTAFDNDLKALISDFDRIEPSLNYDEGGVIITLKVWLKPTIRGIYWQGNCKIESSSLQGELDIKLGSVFDRLGFNQAFHKIKAYYIQQGFFEAQANYEICPDPCSNEVDIIISIEEGRAGRIKKIIFENFSECEEEEIRAQIATKTYFFLTSWLTNEGTYHEDAIQQDEFTILNYLHNEGYADARVNIAVCECAQSNRIIVKITAEKGERYRVGKMTLKGNCLYDDATIEKCCEIGVGGWYSPDKIRGTLTRIGNLYGRDGYIDAVVDYEAKLSEDGCVYDIDLVIEEGQQFRVGLIKVFGNSTTHTRVILNETTIVPGEVFNILKLKRTEARLANIGFFKTVNVYAVKSDGACGLGDNYRDVHIEVEEAPSGHFGIFFGFSTSEELFAGVTLSETNFNYKGFKHLRERGLCALRGGGEYAYLTATVGAKSRSYVASWNKPYVCDTPWVVGFDIDRSSNRYIADDYDFESAGFRLHADYPINTFVRVGCYYRLKYTEIHIADKEEDKAEETLASGTESSHQRKLSEQLLEEQSNSGLISGLGLKLLYDSRNNADKPTEGFRSRFDAECIGIGGKHHYLGFSYLNSLFFQILPWDCDGIWTFRANFRFLQPFSNTEVHTIPLDERLFLGGEDFVRGYRPFRLGPKYPGQDPRGGASLQFVSLEYDFPVFGLFDGFVFCDSGHLSFEPWRFGKMHTSIGYGARIKVIPSMPPLVIGYGFPLTKYSSSSDIKRFFLSLGGTF